jgi:hypothetical protein
MCSFQWRLTYTGISCPLLGQIAPRIFGTRARPFENGKVLVQRRSFPFSPEPPPKAKGGLKEKKEEGKRQAEREGRILFSLVPCNLGNRYRVGKNIYFNNL